MSEFTTLYSRYDGWTDWQMPVRHYRMGCCDCGLVHDVEFRVVKIRDRKTVALNPAGYRVQFRVSRDSPHTTRGTLFNSEDDTDWQPPTLRCRWLCPSCGLIHAVEFRIIKVGRWHPGGFHIVKRLRNPGYRAQYRMSRNKRSTQLMRRRNHYVR